MHLHKNTVLPVAASQETFVTELNLCADLLIFRQPVAHDTAVSGTECKIANVIIPCFSPSLTPHLLVVSQDVAETCILTV